MTRTLFERSAGGVVLVPVGSSLLVALIVLPGSAALALPKGHIEPGESPEQAAVRETREETGLLAEPILELEEISYMFWSRAQNARIAKRVAYFLMRYRAGSPAHHDGEVDGVRLVPIEDAERALRYPGDKRVAAAALAWARAAGYGGGEAKELPD